MKKEKKAKKNARDEFDCFDVVTLAKSYTAMQEPHTSNLFDPPLEPPPFHHNNAEPRYPNTDNNNFDQLLAGARADWFHLSPLAKYPEMKSYELFQAQVHHSPALCVLTNCFCLVHQDSWQCLLALAQADLAQQVNKWCQPRCPLPPEVVSYKEGVPSSPSLVQELCEQRCWMLQEPDTVEGMFCIQSLH